MKNWQYIKLTNRLLLFECFHLTRTTIGKVKLKNDFVENYVRLVVASPNKNKKFIKHNKT